MIHVPEALRINIGLGVIIVLNMVMLFGSVNQTVKIKRLEQTIRDMTHSVRVIHANYTAVLKHP